MGIDTAPPFSARHRRDTLPIDDAFPESARIGLLHLIRRGVAERYIKDWSSVALELQRIAREHIVSYASEKDAREQANRLLTSLAWYRAYDFCERLYSYLPQEVGYQDNDGSWCVTNTKSEVQQFFANELQQLFQEENLSYEFRDGLVQRRGRRHTVETVAKADASLVNEGLDAARKHFSKAQQFFRDRVKPDPENAVKEAVCAVEAAAKDLFPEARASTLDAAIKWLVASGKLPKTLAQTLTGLYAFRGGGDGVSHGGTGGGAATPEIAEYVLAAAASQIILLKDLASKEAEVPF